MRRKMHPIPSGGSLHSKKSPLCLKKYPENIVFFKINCNFAVSTILR